ncbi:MAG: ATP-binding cassette domain-containing protein [Melioribacteraceae bacterium]|nr:ATP-binding cassette domain-containing protein [Melioribacteraceae bacterium]
MIVFKNVVLKFSSKEHFALKDISFYASKGEILGIVGLSGSGKTSIVKLLAGLYKADSGRITVNKTDLKDYLSTKKLQILFQNSDDLINPLRTVSKMLYEAYALSGRDPADYTTYQKKIIADLNLEENILDKKGFQLSGGEKQRIGLARILAVDPDILILDELYSAQDFDSKDSITKLLKNLSKVNDKTIIVVAHNLSVLREITDRIIVLKEGRIVEQGLTSVILNNPGHEYTRLLLKSENYDLTTEDIRKELI